jgi:hypothetical protein
MIPAMAARFSGVANMYPSACRTSAAPAFEASNKRIWMLASDRYRRTDPNDRSDFAIGCRILTQPFFFEEANWIAVPPSWSPNIVSFKTYNTGDAEGMALWEAVNDRLNALHSPVIREAGAQFGEPQLIRPRLGQGAFRVLVTDIYHRRCAVTQERTLPALEAAHIRPYGEAGEHEPRNGLLLLFFIREANTRTSVIVLRKVNALCFIDREPFFRLGRLKGIVL